MRLNPITGQPEYLPGDTSAPIYYDYDHQVWVKDGVYQDPGGAFLCRPRLARLPLLGLRLRRCPAGETV